MSDEVKVRELIRAAACTEDPPAEYWERYERALMAKLQPAKPTLAPFRQAWLWAAAVCFCALGAWTVHSTMAAREIAAQRLNAQVAHHLAEVDHLLQLVLDSSAARDLDQERVSAKRLLDTNQRLGRGLAERRDSRASILAVRENLLLDLAQGRLPLQALQQRIRETRVIAIQHRSIESDPILLEKNRPFPRGLYDAPRSR